MFRPFNSCLPQVDSSQTRVSNYLLSTSCGGFNPQNLGCNAPKPLWSFRLPITIRSIYETFKCVNFIMRNQLHSASKFLILKHFDRRNKVILFTLGCKAKNWGHNCTPYSSVEPPLPYTSLLIAWCRCFHCVVCMASVQSSLHFDELAALQWCPEFVMRQTLSRRYTS